MSNEKKTIEERLIIIEKALKVLEKWIKLQDKISSDDTILFDTIDKRLKILEGEKSNV